MYAFEKSEQRGDRYMPVVGGRYYINRVLGEALEGAREAEAALEALREKKDGQENAPRAARGPIQRVEIDAADLVPAHSGRGKRGYVARIHRKPISSAGALKPDDEFAGAAASRRASGQEANEPGVETHLFEHHADLVDFLRDQLKQDQREQS